MKIEKPKKISLEFIYACMGYGRNKPDEDSMKLIEKCQNLVLEASTPTATYEIFDLGSGEVEHTSNDYIYVGNSNFPLEGKAIRQHLKGCRRCILMAVTLGPQVDRLIRKTQLTNMAEAIAMDACASSLTEDICDEINHRLEAELAEQGMGLTSRFSPGYGDLPLETQDIFDKLLDMNKKIGLTQSKEHLLMPRKSVTAILGILPLEELEKRSQTEKEERENEGDRTQETSNEACEVCERKGNCSFKKNGGFCGRITK